MRELTYGQHAMWFTERVGAAHGAFGMALGVWFGPGLDEAALRAACAEVVARHPALRSSVRVVNGVPHLVALDPGPSLVTADLSDEAVRAAVRDPYDLAGGPLCRLALLRGDDRHVLVVAAHHLCFDGMSKDILVRDLAAAYDAALTRSGIAPAPAGMPAEPVALPPTNAPRSASDSPPHHDAARAYWAEHWSTPAAPVLPGLPGGRPLTGAARGACVEFTIGPELAAGLERAATQLNVTRFEFLLAVTHAVLAYYGNTGTLVGVSVSRRTPADAGVIGSFVNELPLSIAAPSATFAAYALDLRRRLREAYRYRSVHVGQVVSGRRPAVSLTPVSVGYRRRGPEPVFTGVTSRVEWMLFTGAARNTLHIQMVDSGTDVAVSLQHDPLVLASDGVRRIGGHLRTALAWAVAGPDRPLWQLELMPAEERALIGPPDGIEPGDDPETTVITLFTGQVRQRPGAIAATDGRRTLSYEELDRFSRAFAARLRAQGIGRGARVAVTLPRSIEALVALLGIMRSGAAYVPVDPTYPDGRRALILHDAAPALVVSSLALDDRDGDPEPDEHAGGPDPRDTAYVMYTSGSTGRPKGVLIPHRGLVNELLGLRDVLGSGPGDRWLALASLSFDISTLELFLPLVTGGTTVIAADRNALDGRGLVAFIADQRVTHVQATPTRWRVLLEAGFGEPPPRSGEGRGEPAPAKPSIVALVGGEALPAALAARLRARVRRLVNVYGPTETTVWATAGDIGPGVDRIDIGRPIANVRVHVLDAELRPMPIGVPGEICIAGAGVGDGYLGRPGLTAERFVPDPYGPAGSRLYRTGDIGYWDSDGRLVWQGRLDNQVKIHGHRIELEEIEAWLLRAPGVDQAAVAVHREGQDARLVAYVVAAGDGLDPAALRQHLARQVMPAMVPTAWVFLESLPRNPNGKVDRRALPEPPPAQQPPARRPPAQRHTKVPHAKPSPLRPPHSTPSHPRPSHPGPAHPEPPSGRPPASTDSLDGGADIDHEELIAQLQAIWREVLQVDEVGIDDDLFDLGGHSLTITRINAKLQEQLGVELPLDVYYDAPTISEIAEVVRQTVQLQRITMGGRW